MCKRSLECIIYSEYFIYALPVVSFQIQNGDCVIKVYYLCMRQVLLWNGARSKIRGIRGLVTGLHPNKQKLT